MNERDARIIVGVRKPRKGRVKDKLQSARNKVSEYC